MVKKNSQRKTVSRRKTSKRKTSKRKTSKRKTSKRKTSKRTTSKRKTSKRKTSKQRKSKRRVSRRKRVSNNKNQNGQGLKDWFGQLRDKIDPPYKGTEEDQKKMKDALKRDVAMRPGVEYCDKGEKRLRGEGHQHDDLLVGKC